MPWDSHIVQCTSAVAARGYAPGGEETHARDVGLSVQRKQPVSFSRAEKPATLHRALVVLSQQHRKEDSHICCFCACVFLRAAGRLAQVRFPAVHLLPVSLAGRGRHLVEGHWPLVNTSCTYPRPIGLG